MIAAHASPRRFFLASLAALTLSGCQNWDGSTNWPQTLALGAGVGLATAAVGGAVVNQQHYGHSHVGYAGYPRAGYAGYPQAGYAAYPRVGYPGYAAAPYAVQPPPHPNEARGPYRSYSEYVHCSTGYNCYWPYGNGR